MVKLYHSDVFVPPQYFNPLNLGLRLHYSAHARSEAAKDRLNLDALPKRLPYHRVIEVEVDEQGVSKVVVRIHFTHGYDLVLVVLPDGFVKTLWLNATDDQHATLNRSRYATN